MSAHAKEKKKTNRGVFVLYIGFFAGLIWGAVKIFENYFKFTSIGIGFMAEPFFKHDFFNTWLGLFIGWFMFTLFSIFAASIYMMTLWRLRSAIWGLCYGAVWWALLYFVIGPITGMFYWVHELELTTVISDFCLFLVWGMFIGYSIAIEYTDVPRRQAIPKS
ncbi:YqhR family membrane protein [Paenibacillus roseipurpureus]|uniref:YqhR family membrane protein n=1 Tax=Paenibacillus roseopurpureus TaxID=2918901 RepID=A0AA96RIT0_9BACL|nr:YqhR family membrane protein [Paenibacillus sp. MBLB1832]WNR42574.1 YqhR family membrane protein [Paenibacillus sp. MBLB1832]